MTEHSRHCQGCGATPTHWDRVGSLCDGCFVVVFATPQPSGSNSLAGHRAECGGACRRAQGAHARGVLGSVKVAYRNPELAGNP